MLKAMISKGPTPVLFSLLSGRCHSTLPGSRYQSTRSFECQLLMGPICALVPKLAFSPRSHSTQGVLPAPREEAHNQSTFHTRERGTKGQLWGAGTLAVMLSPSPALPLSHLRPHTTRLPRLLRNLTRDTGREAPRSSGRVWEILAEWTPSSRVPGLPRGQLGRGDPDSSVADAPNTSSQFFLIHIRERTSEGGALPFPGDSSVS